MNSNHCFFFITGTGRSGTSLLQSMLAAHPQVCMPPETHFIRKYLIKYNVINDQLKETLKNDPELARLNIAEQLNNIIDHADNLANLYRQTLTAYRTSNKQLLYGDKDPRNMDYIPIINKKLSNSKFIHIIRDPRDVVLSRTKANWSKNIPFFFSRHFLSISNPSGSPSTNCRTLFSVLKVTQTDCKAETARILKESFIIRIF